MNTPQPCGSHGVRDSNKERHHHPISLPARRLLLKLHRHSTIPKTSQRGSRAKPPHIQPIAVLQDIPPKVRFRVYRLMRYTSGYKPTSGLPPASRIRLGASLWPRRRQVIGLRCLAFAANRLHRTSVPSARHAINESFFEGLRSSHSSEPSGYCSIAKAPD